MPRWDLFAGLVVLSAVGMLLLARASQQAFAPPAADPSPTARPDTLADTVSTDEGIAEPLGLPEPSTRWLLGNVAASHGLLGGVILAGAWFAEIPRTALGLDAGLAEALGPGIVLGVALYAGNELAATAADRLGMGHDERLRELLAPDTPTGWAALLLIVLPLIAGVEEFLFRAALVGALAAGYGLPIWGLAIVSSLAFGAGHGLQGPGGILVTGALGFVLAAAFILTGSLAVAVIAHYLVNALEFVVHEGLGVSLDR